MQYIFQRNLWKFQFYAVAALVFPAAVAVFLTSVHSLFLRLAPPDLGLGRIGAPASFRRIISCLTVAWSCSQNVFECSAPVSLRSMKFLTQRSANSTHALANERLVASYSVRARSRSGRMSVLHATATPAMTLVPWPVVDASAIMRTGA